MSRTFRRKNAEQVKGVSTWSWSKQYGWYGERQWCGTGLYDWVLPTSRELFKKWYALHGDKKNYFCPPTRNYRRETNRNEKNDYKRQFNRWLHNPEFEIVNNDKMHRDNWGYY